MVGEYAVLIAAIKRVLPQYRAPTPQGLEQRAENSHLAVRKRERTLQCFKSEEHVQPWATRAREPGLYRGASTSASAQSHGQRSS